METTMLFPGVTLRAVRDGRFKSEYLSVVFLCSGELFDRPHAAMLSSVLSRGSRLYPDESILDGALLDLYDASLSLRGNVNGDCFLLSFSLGVHEARYLPSEENVRKRARDLFFSFMLDPLVSEGAFKRKYFADEKKNLLDRLKAEKVNKPYYALSKCLHLMRRGEKGDYTVQDLKKDLRRVSAKSLYDYYTTVIRRAQIEIFYFGGEDVGSLRDDLLVRMRPLFTEKDPLVPDEVSPVKKEPARAAESLEAHQSTLCIGYKTGLKNEKELLAFSLMRELLCLSPVSLIFENVREKQSLCYSCSDRSLPRSGVYVLYAGIDKKNAKRVEELIDLQFEKLKNGDFTEQRLAEAKKTLSNDLKQMHDDPSRLEAWYLRRVLWGREGDPDRQAELLLSLTCEDVIRVASSFTKDCVFLLRGVHKETKDL